MKRRILVALFFVLMANVAYADGVKIPLYKEFYHGMPKGEVQKRSGATPCSLVDAPEALCLKNQTFADVKWLQIFNFSDGKLMHVTLVGDINDKRYFSSISAVINNKFIPVMLQMKDETCDFMKVYNSMDGGEAEAYINEFEVRGIKSQRLLYAFLEEDVLRSVNGASNFFDVVEQAPVTMREVDIEMRNENGASWIAVRFLAPKKTQDVFLKQSKQSKDTF